MKRSPLEIPIQDRYCLTVDEAAAYTLIGQNRLREIIDNNKNADYLLWVGSQVRIKRPEFEKYLSTIHNV